MSVFTRLKYSDLDGKTKVTYTHELEQPGDGLDPVKFVITCQGDGCHFEGSLTIQTEEQLQRFAKILSDAWVDRRKLAPKLTGSVSGH